ncbi:hypothetical protein ScPMuIL_003397 [Solemya velum]
MEKVTTRKEIFENSIAGRNCPSKKIHERKSVDTSRKPILRIYKPEERLNSPDTVDGELSSDYGSCRVYGEHSDWMLAETNQPRSPPTSPDATTRAPFDIPRITSQVYQTDDVCGSKDNYEHSSRHANEDLILFLRKMQSEVTCAEERQPLTPAPRTPYLSPVSNPRAPSQQYRHRVDRYANHAAHLQRNVCHIGRENVRKQLFGSSELGDLQIRNERVGLSTPSVHQPSSPQIISTPTEGHPYSQYASGKRQRMTHNNYLPSFDERHHSCDVYEAPDDIENMYYTPMKRPRDSCDCSCEEYCQTPTKRIRIEPERSDHLNYLKQLKSEVNYLNNSLNCTEPEMRPKDCPCAMITEHFFDLAAKTYESIRRQNTSPEGFEQFKKQLIESNEMLKDSMRVMRDMRGFCKHRSIVNS